MNIKKNDTVIVLSGKDKGVKGKVLVAMPSENKVIVEKVNVATCHTKPRRQGETGGIVKKETPIRTCKVALYCEKCGKFYDVSYIKHSQGVPRCTCGGRIKPDVVLYDVLGDVVCGGFAMPLRGEPASPAASRARKQPFCRRCATAA